jgi:hypothetical protein
MLSNASHSLWQGCPPSGGIAERYSCEGLLDRLKNKIHIDSKGFIQEMKREKFVRRRISKWSDVLKRIPDLDIIHFFDFQN